MRAGLIDDFIRNILSVPFCPYHFVHAILSNTILPVYHFVHTILSVPFCPLPFCPRTVLFLCSSHITQHHLSVCISIYLSIYLSIYEICIAPLQGNYSEALPAQARAKIK